MVGRDRVLGFFGEFMGSVSPDLCFVIDDISGEDPSAVGVTWHLEWKGRPFPFSRGCSFYRCQPDPNQQDRIQIVYGRDCVEPATKPGELALVAIRGVTWILERFPSLACASLRQGLSEPRSGRWRTSSTSGPAPTTTCCCRRRRLRPAAAREGPTLVVACG